MELNEIKIFCSLQIYDYAEARLGDGRQMLYVVMEFGSKDLARLLKDYTDSERGLTEVKTKFYWEEMLEAVQVAHQVKDDCLDIVANSPGQLSRHIVPPVVLLILSLAWPNRPLLLFYVFGCLWLGLACYVMSCPG